MLYCLANEGGSEVDSSELSQLAESMLHPEVMSELLPGGVLRLRPSCFGTGMRSAFVRALQPFSAEPRPLIVDLRGCPGGDLIEAAYLAADFLTTGQAQVELDCGGEHEVISVEASARWGMPLWVLIDRTSASAAEVFAAIVKSAGRARLVGERSYGKGSVQRVVTGADRSLRADVATWSVAGQAGSAGVTPDVELAADPACTADADLWLKTTWALALRSGGWRFSPIASRCRRRACSRTVWLVFFADSFAISASSVLAYGRTLRATRPPTSLALDENHSATFLTVPENRSAVLGTRVLGGTLGGAMVYRGPQCRCLHSVFSAGYERASIPRGNRTAGAVLVGVRHRTRALGGTLGGAMVYRGPQCRSPRV